MHRRAVLLGFLPIACAPSVSEMDGFVVEGDAVAEGIEAVERRGAAELSCPRDELSIKLVAVQDDAGPDMPETFAVRGCGKLALYSRQFGEWKLDSLQDVSVDLDAAAAAPTEPSVQQISPASEEAWWCFESVPESPAGVCRPTAEECAAALEGAVADGMPAGPTCNPASDVVCLSATMRTAGGEMQICYPSRRTCDAGRTALTSMDGWNDVSACAASGRTAAKTACDGGDAKACLALAREEHDAGDHAQSLVWTAKACRADDVAACVHVARALESGEGVASDRGKAARFYKAACKLGHDESCEHFARLRAAE